MRPDGDMRIAILFEVHPEELLDKEAAGRLTSAERTLLHAHASRCSACRCERRLRVEFEAVLAAGTNEVASAPEVLAEERSGWGALLGRSLGRSM